ncbi:MAG: MBL fold metallo-hydrolase [Candidatus Hodarchaeota archaeon]
MVNDRSLESKKAVELMNNLWWIGWPDHQAGFSNNPYLLVDEDIVVLIDPGSGLDEHWAIVRQKIESVIPLEKVTTVIVHHQDPDLCGCLPHLEKVLGINNFEIVTSERTALFIPYYNVRTEVTPIQDGDTFEIGEDHDLLFLTAPYLHFPGAFTTYDLQTKVLFSGDIFGAFSVDWNLFANEYYPEAMKVFGEPYFPSKQAIRNWTRKIKPLEIRMICPQHGSIIKEHIPQYISTLEEMDVGIWARWD